MGCEWDPGTPLTHPPGAQPTHLDEGLGLQRAHCLHQAVAKLQVLLQSQRVDGQEGHVGLWGGGQWPQVWGWSRGTALPPVWLPWLPSAPPEWRWETLPSGPCRLAETPTQARETRPTAPAARTAPPPA